MVLKRYLDQSPDVTVRTERCKMLASGTQLIAIGVLVAAVIAPVFNTTLHPTLWTRVAGGLAFAAIELLALRILGYLAITPTPED